ncbi:MAG: hypothetical protein NC180_10675 [Muribaculaceae bacterium]|nr:hypothetical protein [Roseburia sp.]MCM1430242.1 hypothetical protein [Muribaculaceae bacterium]MCM1493676.1 hypothetical protein [Muribaculaceae bacterium]
MKHIHSKNSLFLMEIILNLLLFVLLMLAALQLFIRSHTLTTQTGELHQAITCCTSAASVFESGDGTLQDILEYYSYGINLNSQVIVYLDADFCECQREEARYYLSIAPMTEDSEPLAKAEILCLTAEGEEIYSLTACHYRQRQLSSRLFETSGEVPL